MKRIIGGMLLTVIGIFSVSQAMAVSLSSTPVAVTADVKDDMTMSLKLFKNDITGTEITAGGAMNFGELIDIGTGTLRSSAASTTGTGAVLACVTVNSHGKPWTLKQTGSDLTSGGASLERGSLVVKPVYLPVDNGGIANDGSIGGAGSWVASDRLLYSSSASGRMKTIRAYYSITDDPVAGAASPSIPLDKAAGTYTGTVTFTVTS
jgi:hypothetical protein